MVAPDTRSIHGQFRNRMVISSGRWSPYFLGISAACCLAAR